MPKFIFLFSIMIVFRIALYSQVLYLGQIYVANNADSLQKKISSKKGMEYLNALLSYEKSNTLWESTMPHKTYIDLIKKELKKNPLAEGHYYFFKSREVGSNGSFENVFLESRKAYEFYKSQQDSVGVISALLNMSLMGNNHELNSPKNRQYLQQYLKEAVDMGEKSNNVELQILSCYAFTRYIKKQKYPAEAKQLFSKINKTIQLIDKNPTYLYYKPYLLNILAMLHEMEQKYGEAQQNISEIMDIYRKNGKRIQAVDLYNLGFYYEMQKKYTEALVVTQQTGYKKTLVSYEVEKKDARNRILEKEIQLAEAQSQLYLRLAIGAVIILLGTVFFIYHLRRANMKLDVAYKEIVQLNQTRDYFFRMIAHDMRRPLFIFQSMAELIKFHIVTRQYDGLEETSHSIDQMGLRIRLLLDNLLMWALNQREEMPYSPEKVSLIEKIQTISDLYQEIAHYQKIDIQTDGGKEVNVYADPNACELIIRNLLDNALKNTLAGGKILLKVEKSQEDGCINIRVEDTGVGMSPEKLSAVQEILQHPEIRPNHPRGMGLIMVGRFLKSNRITVTVTSTVGKGTTFLLNFTCK